MKMHQMCMSPARPSGALQLDLININKMTAGLLYLQLHMQVSALNVQRLVPSTLV